MAWTNPKWEEHIYKLGLLYQNPQVVWDQVVEQLPSTVDLLTQQRLFHLANLCQTQDKLIMLFHQWWGQNQPIHWGCYLNLLSEVDFKLDDESLLELWDLVRDQPEEVKALSLSREARQLVPEIGQAFSTWWTQEEQARLDRFHNTYNQLEVLYSQGLWDQAEETLIQLKKMAPKDHRWPDWEIKIKKEKAQAVLERPVTQKPVYIKYLAEAVNPAVAADNLSSNSTYWKEYFEKTQVQPYDQALFFLFADQVDIAENILKDHKNLGDARSLWLLLDCYLIQEKFIEAYDLLENTIKQQLLKPETPEDWLRYYYEMARIHWGLGDNTKALQFIDHVIEIDPDWRDALLLRSHWLSHESTGRE